MTEDKQSAALARWLDAGGRGDPPAGIDEDVLEAVFALRPELAPAPKLDLDDLLAGITTGPFAATVDDEPGGEVVPFPVPASLPADAEREVRPAPRARAAARPWWRQWAVGGVAGALAAAAAVVLVVLGTDDPGALTSPAAMRRPSAKEAVQTSERLKILEQPTATESEVAQARPLDAAPPDEERGKSGPLDAVALSSATASGASARGDGAPTDEKKRKDVAAASEEAPRTSAMAGKRDAELVDQWAVEPLTQTGQLEPSNTAADDAVVYGEADELADKLGYAEGAGAVTATRAAAPGGRQRKSVAAAPAAAAEAPPPPPSPTADRSFDPTNDWRASLDAATRQRVDGALQVAALRASQGAPRTAALDLRPHIQAPPRAGQAVAAQAAQYALQAGDDRLAAELIELGLALGGPGTTEHAALLRLRTRAAPAKAGAADAAPAEAEAN